MTVVVSFGAESRQGRSACQDFCVLRAGGGPEAVEIPWLLLLAGCFRFLLRGDLLGSMPCPPGWDVKYDPIEGDDGSAMSCETGCDVKGFSLTRPDGSEIGRFVGRDVDLAIVGSA